MKPTDEFKREFGTPEKARGVHDESESEETGMCPSKNQVLLEANILLIKLGIV